VTFGREDARKRGRARMAIVAGTAEVMDLLSIGPLIAIWVTARKAILTFDYCGGEMVVVVL
jgi:hypothetical protein